MYDTVRGAMTHHFPGANGNCTKRTTTNDKPREKLIMDLIVATCRALANHHRLELLRAIHEQPGIAVQVLATKVDLEAPVVSKHLKLLRDLHLVQMTPQGRFVHCSPPRPGSTRNGFLTDMQKLLRTIFGAGDRNRTLSKVCNSTGTARGGWSDVYEALMAGFTTFTHLRRLMILRWLAQHKTGSPEELVARVGMSADAARRHLDKLRRRGVVQIESGTSERWTIRREGGSPFHRQLLESVLRGLRVGY